MPISPTLTDAAERAYFNMNTLWLANTLKASLTTFITTLLPLFPEQEPNSHPVSNWLTLLYAVTSTMPSTNVPFENLVKAADHVYRLCFMTNQLATQSPQLITTAQAAAVLAAYNADIV